MKIKLKDVSRRDERKNRKEPKPRKLRRRKQRRENDNKSTNANEIQECPERPTNAGPAIHAGPPPHAQPDVREHEVVDSWVVHRLRLPRGATPKTNKLQNY